MNEENINYVTCSDASDTAREHPHIFTFNELFIPPDTLTNNVMLISTFLSTSGAVKF